MATVNVGSVIVWAFNPKYINITATGTATRADVSVGGNSIQVVLLNGSARVEISRLLQNCFDVNNIDDERFKVVAVDVTVRDVTSQTFLYVLWGTLGFGERYGKQGAFIKGNNKTTQTKTIQYFKNFPFTVELFRQEDTVVDYAIDGSSMYQRLLGNVEEPEITSITPSGIPFVTNKLTLRCQDPEDESGYSTMIWHLKVRHETEGCYLRWIDRLGFISYYLFDKGEVSTKNEPSKTEKKRPLTHAGIDFATNTRNIGITEEREMKVSAQSLDKETFEQVQSVITSPIVDMYLGKDKNGTDMWCPVTIASGTCQSSEHHHTTLQDLTFTIKLPNRTTQTL